MSAAVDPAPASTSLTELVVVIFLAVAAVALPFIYFVVIPSRASLEPKPFDLKNPMLSAKVGECVVLDTTPSQGGVACIKVKEPGLVLRPRSGPARLGAYRDLKRSAPYLTCGMRNPLPGRDCSEAEGREEVLLFDLNAFGMPLNLNVALDFIKPRWVEKGGQTLFVYEAQLTQYGPAASGWFVSVDPAAPVTGTVLRRHATEHQMQQTIFTPADGCR